jgi:hypothetical protein
MPALQIKSVLLSLGLAAALILSLSAAESGIPPVSMREAVSLAEEFLRANQIDVSHQQMSKATLGKYPGGPDYWDLHWSDPDTTVKRDPVDLRIEMDRTVIQLIHAEALSISIAVPALNERNERLVPAIDQNSHFAVILCNTSKQPQGIVTPSNSWGDQALRFEITDKAGRKSVARRVAIDYPKNILTWWVLHPGESVVLDVYFADAQKWEGFPRFEHYGETETVTVRAIFEYGPAERKPPPDGLWRGRVVSKPEQIVFSNLIPEKK